MGKIIELQEQFRRALPKVLGCKDYRNEEQLLERVDRILRVSGVERKFLELSRAKFEAQAQERKVAGEPIEAGGRALERHLRQSERASAALHGAQGAFGRKLPGDERAAGAFAVVSVVLPV